MGKINNKEKSQATIYIIIGILILVGVAIFLLTRQSLNIDSPNNPEIKPIYSSVQNCISDIAKRGVFETGLYGGYYHTSKYSTDYSIPYYFDKGINRMPTKLELQNQLSNFVNDGITLLCQDFTNYSEFNIIPGNVTSSVKIEDNKVILNIDYPLSIKKGNKN